MKLGDIFNQLEEQKDSSSLAIVAGGFVVILVTISIIGLMV
jgi:hypothetical protein